MPLTITKPHNPLSAHGPNHRPSPAPSPRLQEAVREAIRGGRSDSEIWQTVVGELRRDWKAPYAAVRLVTSRGLVQEEACEGDTAAVEWRGCVIPELTDAVTSGDSKSRLFQDTTRENSIAVHTIAVHDSFSQPCGAIAVVTAPMTEPDGEAMREQLAAIVEICRRAGWDPDESPPSNRAEVCEPPSRTSAATDYMNEASLAARFESLDELAFSLTNAIKTQLSCSEVSLGLVRGRRIHLLATSGTDAVYRNTPGAVRICQAMEECLDHHAVVYSQETAIESELCQPLEMPIHQRWRSGTQGSNCVSIALGRPGAATAVLSMRRAKGKPFTAAELSELQSQFASLGEAMAVLQRARRGLLKHLADACCGAVRSIGRASRLRSIVIGGGVIVAAWLLLRPWPHHVYVEARLDSPVGRIYAAPIEGRLVDVHVLPGERVRPGELLFEMATGELESDRATLASQQRLQRVRMVQALRDHDPSGAAAARSMLEASRLALDEIENQLEGARVVATVGGVATAGSGHLRIGERVPFGEPIVEIAAADHREIVLRLDDEFAGDIRCGMRGWFAPHGEPHRKLAIEVVRIEHQAEVEQGRNLVSVWARMEDDPESLPLGAEGYARVTGTEEPGWWILLHKPLRKLRWHLWPL